MCGSQRRQAEGDSSPVVLESYFPTSDDAPDRRSLDDADLHQSTPSASLAGINTLLDEVRRLLERERYIFYQPVCEACEACSNHLGVPEVGSFAKDCFKDIFEIMLSQSPSKISPTNITNCEKAVVFATTVCIHFIQKRDMCLVACFVVLLDGNRPFYGRLGEAGRVEIHKQVFSKFLKTCLPTIKQDFVSWPGCSRAGSLIKLVASTALSCREFPHQEAMEIFGLFTTKLLSLSDGNLKKEDLKEMEQMLLEFEKVCTVPALRGPFTPEDEQAEPEAPYDSCQYARVVYEFWLKLCVRLFRSSSLKHRFFGMDQIIFLATKRANCPSTTTDNPLAQHQEPWLTNQKMVDWLHESRIFEELLGDHVHADLVNRSLVLLRYLVDTQGFTKPMIGLLWQCGLGKHESVALAINQAVLQVANHLPSSLLLYMFQLMRHSLSEGDQGWAHTVRLGVRLKSQVFSDKGRDVVDSVLDLLWVALQLFPNVAADLKEVDSLSTVFTDLLRSQQDHLAVVQQYFDSCWEHVCREADRDSRTYREEKLLLCVLDILGKIVSMPAVPFADTASCVKLFLHELQTFSNQQQRARTASTDQSIEETSSTSVVLSEHAWGEHVMHRLGLLQAVLQSTQASLTVLEVNRIWNILSSPCERECCLQWFREIFLAPSSSAPYQSEPMVDADVCDHIFEKLLCQHMLILAPSLGREGYSCFRCFMLDLNKRDGRLRDSPNDGYVLGNSELLGIDALWTLILHASEEIAADGTSLLVSLQLAPPAKIDSPVINSSVDPDNQESFIDHVILYVNKSTQELQKIVEDGDNDHGTDSVVEVHTQRWILASQQARRCVALMQAALRHQDIMSHNNCGRLHGHQTTTQTTKEYLPHGRSAQGWPCSLSLLFQHDADATVQPMIDVTGSETRSTLHLQCHSNLSLGEIRARAQQWLNLRVASDVILQINSKKLLRDYDQEMIDSQRLQLAGGRKEEVVVVVTVSETSEQLKPRIVSPPTNPLGALIASKQDVFDCLFTLLRLPQRSRELQELQQHVWHLLQLIPTNPVQRAHFQSQPLLVDWARELMVDGEGDDASVFSFDDQPTYALQVVEALLNPRQSLFDSPKDTRSHDAVAWRQAFVCSQSGFSSVIRVLHKLMVVDTMNGTAHCLRTKGRRRYGALGVGLRVIKCCLLEALLDPDGITQDSVSPVHANELFGLLIRVVTYAHDLSRENRNTKVETQEGGGGVDQALEHMVMDALWCFERLVESHPDVLILFAEEDPKESLLDRDGFQFAFNVLLEYPASEVQDTTCTMLIKICDANTSIRGHFTRCIFFHLEHFSFEHHSSVKAPTISDPEQFFALCEYTIPSLFPADSVSGRRLLNLLVCRLCDLPGMQLSSSDQYGEGISVDQPALAGWLNLLRALLAEWTAARGDACAGHRLISLIVNSLLFSVPTVGRKGAFSLARDSRARQAAFELLAVSCEGCDDNLGHLLDLVENMVDGCSDATAGQRATSSFDLQHWILLQDYSQQANQREVIPAGSYVGLNNLGCTCYINSVIQQLFLFKAFRDCVLSADLRKIAGEVAVVEDNNAQTQIEDSTLVNNQTDASTGGKADQNSKSGDSAEIEKRKADEIFVFEMQRTFCYLLESTSEHFDPSAFVSACHVLDLPFPVHHQNDASEFCGKLLDKLETILGYKKHLDSLFGGQLVAQNIRLPCSHMTEEVQNFVQVQLEIRGKKSIEDSLHGFVEGELLEGENTVFCESCDTKRSIRRRSCFSKLPQLLIFNLKRFETTFTNLDKFETVKINDRCEFPFELDMWRFTKKGLETSVNTGSDAQLGDRSSCGSREYWYTLVGILVHSGGADAGHYYSIVRDPHQRQLQRRRKDVQSSASSVSTSNNTTNPSNSTDNGTTSSNSAYDKWLRFDDRIVEPFHMTPTNLASECFGGEEIRDQFYTGHSYQESHPIEKSAFMLFYERVDCDIQAPGSGADRTKDIYNPGRNSLQNIVRPRLFHLQQPCPPQLASFERELWQENQIQMRRSQVAEQGMLHFVLDLIERRAKERKQAPREDFLGSRLAVLGACVVLGPLAAATPKIELQSKRWINALSDLFLCSLPVSVELLRQLTLAPQFTNMLSNSTQDKANWRKSCAQLLVNLVWSCCQDQNEQAAIDELQNSLKASLHTLDASTSGLVILESLLSNHSSAVVALLCHLLRTIPTYPPTQMYEPNHASVRELFRLLWQLSERVPALLDICRAIGLTSRFIQYFIASKRNLVGAGATPLKAASHTSVVPASLTTSHHDSTLASLLDFLRVLTLCDVASVLPPHCLDSLVSVDFLQCLLEESQVAADKELWNSIHFGRCSETLSSAVTKPGQAAAHRDKFFAKVEHLKNQPYIVPVSLVLSFQSMETSETIIRTLVELLWSHGSDNDFRTSASFALRSLLCLRDGIEHHRFSLVFGRELGVLNVRAERKNSIAVLSAVARFVSDLHRNNDESRRWISFDSLAAFCKIFRSQVQRRHKLRISADFQELFNVLVLRRSWLQDVAIQAGKPVPRLRPLAGEPYCVVQNAGSKMLNGRYLKSEKMFNTAPVFTRSVGPVTYSIILCKMQRTQDTNWYISYCVDPPGTDKDTDYYHCVISATLPPQNGWNVPQRGFGVSPFPTVKYVPGDSEKLCDGTGRFESSRNPSKVEQSQSPPQLPPQTADLPIVTAPPPLPSPGIEQADTDSLGVNEVHDDENDQDTLTISDSSTSESASLNVLADEDHMKQLVQQLIDMGFSADQATRALKMSRSSEIDDELFDILLRLS